MQKSFYVVQGKMSIWFIAYDYFPNPNHDPPPVTSPQGFDEPPFQLGQRSSSLTPLRASVTCMPHPAHVAFPQALQFTLRHIMFQWVDESDEEEIRVLVDGTKVMWGPNKVLVLESRQ